MMMRSPLAIGPAVRAMPRPSRGAARAARWAGLLCGLAAFALALQGWGVRSTGTALGTDLAVVAVVPGEIELRTSGAALQAVALQPGAPAVSGSMRVRNITAVPLRLRIRVLPATRALDEPLVLTVTARGRRIASGSAGALRRWSTRPLVIGVRQTLTLHLSARLRGPAQGLIADVALEFAADPISRRR